METELRTRVITGIAMAVAGAAFLFASASWPQGQWLLCAVGFLVAGISSGEFARICIRDRSNWVRGSIYFFILLLPAFVTFGALTGSWSELREGFMNGALQSPFVGFVLAALAASTYIVTAPRQELAQAENISRDLLIGLVHVGFGGACLVALASLPGAWALVLWLLLVVCLNDIAAYFGGRAIGGPKLAPVVSPNKTIAGSVCGIAAGVIVGTVSHQLLPLPAHGYAWLLAVVVVYAAQIGDLVKSYVKRLHGVKDSGSLLPGHGGVLDRVDGLLMSAPVVYLLAIAL